MPHSQTFLDPAEGGCPAERGCAGQLPVHGGTTRISTEGHNGGQVKGEIHTQVHMVVLCYKPLAIAPLPATCLLHSRSTINIHYRGIPRYTVAWVLETLIVWSVDL